MKFVRNFKSLDQAKGKTLYSPTIIKVTENGQSKMLTKNLGKDIEITIPKNTSSLDDIVIKKQYLLHYNSSYGECPDDKKVEESYSLKQSDLPTLSEEGYIFNGWNKTVGTVVNDNIIITASWSEESIDYLSFTSIGTSTITLGKVGSSTTPNIQYSKDKQKWSVFTSSDGTRNTISLNNGETVYLKGNNNYINNDGYPYNVFSMAGTISAGGNIMSILDETCQSKTISFERCYQSIFAECTSLITAPELPATTLADYCYVGMFYGCTALITAPELPATTLACECYGSMFSECTGLTAAPILQATTLGDYCYNQMFYYCTKITNIYTSSSETANALLNGTNGYIGYDRSFNIYLNNIYQGQSATDQPVCFVENTPVLMADGTSKMIQNIVEGDYVLGYDETSQTNKSIIVKHVMSHPLCKEIYQITLEDDSYLKLTPNHPIYTDSGYKAIHTSTEWTNELTTSDKLLSSNGTWLSIKHIGPTNDEPQTVYNIDTDEPYDNFYVGMNGTQVPMYILAHNKTG